MTAVRSTNHTVAIAKVQRRCGRRGGCHRGWQMWAAKRHVSLALVAVVRGMEVGGEKICFAMFRRRLRSQQMSSGLCHFDIRDAPGGSPSSRASPSIIVPLYIPSAPSKRSPQPLMGVLENLHGSCKRARNYLYW